MAAPEPNIVGAGFAGLLAAHVWQRSQLFEASPEPQQAHNALLRFRSDVVAQLTGIEFRRVTVHKSIWFEGREVTPSIRVANAYNDKVLGALTGDRSIWNIAPTERYVAPENLYAMLVDRVGKRINWDTQFDFITAGPEAPIVNTAPLPVVVKAIGEADSLAAAGYAFGRAPIKVARFRLRGADVFQTVYFPGHETSVYRASITGDVLIVEFIDADELSLHDLALVATAMWLPSDMEDIGRVSSQRYGKIDPLPEAKRKSLLFNLTSRYGIYSLGRFATWRNVLLDDVVKDAHVIKRLINSSSYDLRREAT